MDKRVILAVAGSGKTTYLVNHLSQNKRTLIITYTDNNYDNIRDKILREYRESWPENVTVMRYFQFLYQFCYKPLFSDECKAKGIDFDSSPPRWAKKRTKLFYLTNSNYFYSNRLAAFLEDFNATSEIKRRLEKYFDEFVIDEVQDIAGRDFNLLQSLMSANLNMLFVGDFYQHTYDTSRDGTVNKTLFSDIDSYEMRFSKAGIFVDKTTLQNSWRCSKAICDYVRENFGIMIYSAKTSNENIIICVTDPLKIEKIYKDPAVVKLHYNGAAKYGKGHKNWGDTKGQDCYTDVCVLLNKTAYLQYTNGTLQNLAMTTRNKLYVALTRAKGNVYLIEEAAIKQFMDE